MTLAQNIIWEIRANGAITNGGGFLIGASGTDFSQQDSPQYALTGVTTAGADAILLDSAAASDMVGNVGQLVSGTNAITGWYEIKSVVVGVSITVDRTCTSGALSSGVFNIGGAMFWLDAWFEAWNQGNRAFVKQDGTHTLITSLNVAKNGQDTKPMRIEGYKTTRGDADANPANRPVIDVSNQTFGFNDYWQFYNLNLTGTTDQYCKIDLEGLYQHCKFNNTSGTSGRYSSNFGNRGSIINCEFQSVNGQGIRLNGTGTRVLDCYFHDCGAVTGTNSGMHGTGDDGIFVNLIFDTCGRGMFIGSPENTIIKSVTVYNCITGIGMSNPRSLRMDSIILDSCTTGLSRSSVVDVNNPNTMSNINFSNNGTDKVNIGFITNETSLDPQFVDAPGGDFETGSNMEVTYAWPGGLTSTTVKLGAVQNAGGGGGGLARSIFDGSVIR